MAFNINAQVILSGPKNIKAVQKKIKSGLQGVTASIDLKVPKNLSKQLGSFNKGLASLNKNISALQSSAATANAHLSGLGKQFNSLNNSSKTMAKSQASVQTSLKNTAKQVGEARSEIQAFGKDAALAIRRFSAFTVATGVVFGFVRAVQTATKAAIDYEREITRVVQVTGASAGSIGKLKNTIDDLSTSLGVDANELAKLARTFAQTGQSIDQVRDSIRAVARSTLAPSFGEMKNTAEGLIAALAQFNIAAKDSEAVLSSINAVSKRFAVEAEDLVSVIRRAGGVFSQAAGQFDDPKQSLNELIGIFTAVRSTTRETADTIAVGLRTIFTRIQRRGTIEFLKQFNIELVDAQGNFVGLFPAFQKLSQGLGDIIRKGDALTLSAITEELGGVRQVGKLIPAITQFNKALAATKIAGEAAKEGLGRDVALALQPLGKQFEQLQQRFMTLVRTISESKTFQNLAKVALSIGNAFLTVAETLKPLIPLMTTFAAIKISKGLFEFGKGFIGGFSKGGGVAGAGETLGGGISGGTTKERRSADRGVQQALTSAMRSNIVALGNNTTALGGVTTSLQGMGNTITNTTTQILGAVGNLINALNRFGGGGGGGFGAFGRTPKKFAKGGPVTGPSHAQGGVPAILEGGEYVIPKGYAEGGTVLVTLKKDKFGGAFFEGDAGGLNVPEGQTVHGKKPTSPRANLLDLLNQSPIFPRGAGEEPIISAPADKRAGVVAILKHLQDKSIGARKVLKGKANITGHAMSLLGKKKDDIEGKTKKGILSDLEKEGYIQSSDTAAIGNIKIKTAGPLTAAVATPELLEAGLLDEVKALSREAFGGLLSSITSSEAFKQVGVRGTPLDPDDETLKTAVQDLIAEDAKSARTAIEGYILEGLIASVGQMKMGGGQTTFDFHGGQAGTDGLDDIFGEGAGAKLNSLKAFDAKRTMTAEAIKSIVSQKAAKEMEADDILDAVFMASGGPVFKPRGTDTVPAMLTPGEFVINKGSAEKIGYGNLGKMNHLAKGGVAAKGNVMQYFRAGGGGGYATAAAAASPLPPDDWWKKFIDSINAAGNTLDVWDRKIQNSGVRVAIKLNRLGKAASDTAKDMAGGTAGAVGGAVGLGMDQAATLLSKAANGLVATGSYLKERIGRSWSDWLPDQAVADSGVDNRPPTTPPAAAESMRQMQTDAQKKLQGAQADEEKAIEEYTQIMANSASTAEEQDAALKKTIEAMNKSTAAQDELTAATEMLKVQEKAAADATAYLAAKREAAAAETALGSAEGGGTVKDAKSKQAELQTSFGAAKEELRAAKLAQKVSPDLSGDPTMEELAAGLASAERLGKARENMAQELEKRKAFNKTAAGKAAKADQELQKARQAHVNSTLEMTRLREVGTLGVPGGGAGGPGGGADGAAVGNLIGGMGSAVAAVSGFTVALSSFDAEQPLASIMSLGFAASQAKEAMSVLGPALEDVLPGLKEMVGSGSPAGKALDTFGKEMDGVKGAPKKVFRSLAEGVKEFMSSRASGTKSGKALAKSLKVVKNSLLKSFNVNSLKGLLAKGLTGLPGIVTSLIAGPIVGAISGAISSSVFGDLEKVEGTNIEGFKDASAGGGAVAGALGAAGGAASAGLATAAMFGPVIGAFVAGGVLIKGAIQGFAKQMEFNAFKELGSAVKDATKTMERFAKIATVTPGALGQVNSSLNKVESKFDKSFEASFKRERVDQAFSVSGMLGQGGFLQGGGIGTPAGMNDTRPGMGSRVGGAAASTVAGIGAGAAIGATVGSVVPLIGTAIGAAVGAVVGGLTGLGAALFTTDKRLEATGKAFDKAAKQITPEFLEHIEKTFQKTINSISGHLDLLDSDAIQSFSQVTPEASTDSTVQSFNTREALIGFSSAMAEAEESLGGAEGAGRKFVKQLNEMIEQKVKFNLTKAVLDEAELLGEEGGAELKGAFVELRSKIDFGDTPQSVEKGFRNLRNEILKSKTLTEEQKQVLLDASEAQAESTLAQFAHVNAMKMAEQAARASAAAFDALAAGLQNFASQTGAIGDNLSQFTSDMQEEFNSLFSDSLQIGTVKGINPFANIDAASKSQISEGMQQVRSLSGVGQDDPAFEGIEGLVSGTKEIPFAVADALRELAPQLAAGTVDDSTVFKEVKRQLTEERGIELPPNALKALEKTIEAGRLSRQGAEGGAGFAAEALAEVLGQGGDVEKQLIALGEEGRKAMEVAFEAATKYKNSLLKVASLQQQMVEKERSMKLSILDKEASVRDRINAAMGKTPDAMAQATSDLRNRLETLTAPVGGAGVGGVANVFDVKQLTKQREALVQKRDELRATLGTAPTTGVSDSEREAADEETSKKLGEVNAQLNGNTQALQTLANDTRQLAAIEQEIAGLQKKALSAEEGALSLAEAEIQLAEGTMTAEDFKKNFTDPINTVRDLASGKAVSGAALIDALKRFKSGDAVTGGEWDEIIRQQTAARRAKGENVTESDVRKDIENQLEDRKAALGQVAARRRGDFQSADTIGRRLDTARRTEEEIKGKGDEMQTVGDRAIEAEKALFESQKAGFKEIFNNANEGLTEAADKFKSAVDDFRDLRGKETTSEKAQENVRQRQQKVDALKAERAAETDPKKQKALDGKIQDAEAGLKRAQTNLRDAQDKEVKAAQEEDRQKKAEAQANVKEVSRSQVENRMEKRLNELGEMEDDDLAAAGRAAGAVKTKGMSPLDFAKEVQKHEILNQAREMGIETERFSQVTDPEANKFHEGMAGSDWSRWGSAVADRVTGGDSHNYVESLKGSVKAKGSSELLKDIMQQEAQATAGDAVQNTAEEKIRAKHAAQAANSEAAPTATPAQKDVARETARQQTVEEKKLPANDPRRRGQTATDMWNSTADMANLPTAAEMGSVSTEFGAPAPQPPTERQWQQIVADAAEGEDVPVPPDRAAAHEEWQKGQQDLVNRTARAQTAAGTTIMERMRRQGLQAGNVSTSMGTRDTQERFSGALEMQRAGVRAGVGRGVFGGGGARGATGRRRTKRQTRQERIAANIAKGEEKLKKLEGRGVGSSDAYRNQQEKLANMRGLIDDPTQAAMQGKAGDPTQLPPEARKAQQKKPAAAAGSAEQLAQTGETLAEKMHETFVTGGDYVANRITEAFKTIPEEIRLNATLGPVTVNLAGGQVLEELKNGILSEMRGAIQSAIQARFNADGSVKDASTQSVVPRDPGGRPMGHHRGEVEL